MIKRLQTPICLFALTAVFLLPHLADGQKGLLQFSAFGGQSRYLIEKNTSTVDYMYNHVGISYGLYLTNRISIIGTNEFGNLMENKVVLSPSIGSLSSHYFSGSLGLQFPILQINKSHFLELPINPSKIHVDVQVEKDTDANIAITWGANLLKIFTPIGPFL
jgi:hypothetical protein